MAGEEVDRIGKTVPFWNLAANPIFRRYCRSRLRPKALIPWILVVGILASFVFLAIWVAFSRSDQGDSVMAGRVILIVLIPIQGMLLMVFGTGAVAAGMMLEGEDGGVEYQRLTPLSPLAKIVGYLFGLPVREYCLFFVTVPLTILAMIAGQVPVEGVLSVYATFFTAALLYHLSGCVAGSVVNRRFAGRIAQMIVVILYLVLPQLAKLGFEFFSYLTILPVVKDLISDLAVPYADDMFAFFFGNESRQVSLFGLDLEALQFSILMQGTLILTFVVILFRKWRQPTNHMLGKNFAVGLCIWLHVLLIGSTLPLIDSGQIFPDNSGEVARKVRQARRAGASGVEAMLMESRLSNQKNPKHAYWLTTSFGLGALVLSCGLVLIITPSRDEFTKGLRRARKLGRRRVRFNADGATGFWHVLVIAAVGAASFGLFATEMFGSWWFSKAKLGDRAIEYSEPMLQLVPFSQILFVLVFWAVLEWAEKRALLLFTLFFWIVPVLAGLVFLLGDFTQVAILLGGVSALPSSFYALSFPVEDGRWWMRATAQMFLFAVAIYSVLVIYLMVRVRSSHLKIIRRVEEGDVPPPALREVEE